jgi:hypothetical protein
MRLEEIKISLSLSKVVIEWKCLTVVLQSNHHHLPPLHPLLRAVNAVNLQGVKQVNQRIRRRKKKKSTSVPAA